LLRAYRLLLTLYPQHVRAMYDGEMLADFRRRLEGVRQARVAALFLFAREVVRVIPDALSEHVAARSSHPSFHGRRPSSLGVVRPPNVGKREWFYADDPPPADRQRNSHG
jgi:hypothetical protein